MSQLNLLDALHAPAIIRPVDRDGHVLDPAIEPDEVLVLPHPRYAWDRCRIELHRHTDDDSLPRAGRLWMWSTSWQTPDRGSSYRVGAKWGQFAETRDDALFHAIAEIRERMGELDDPEAAIILRWLEGLL